VSDKLQFVRYRPQSSSFGNPANGHNKLTSLLPVFVSFTRYLNYDKLKFVGQKEPAIDPSAGRTDGRFLETCLRC
jgi:hypothetical protein